MAEEKADLDERSKWPRKCVMTGNNEGKLSMWHRMKIVYFEDINLKVNGGELELDLGVEQ